MFNYISKQNDKHESYKKIKRETHTFIIRILPRYLSNEDEEKWHGEFQYVRKGEKLVDEKFKGVKNMLATLVTQIKNIIRN